VAKRDANDILLQSGADGLREALDNTPAESLPPPPRHEDYGVASSSPQEQERIPPRIVRPTMFFGRTPPTRRWIVRDWIPCGAITGLYGAGGLGKSLLAQQLQTGTALGTAWLGLPVEEIVSLGVYCEDDEDELWRRQCAITADYGCDLNQRLASVHWMPRFGEDNILMTFTRSGVGQPTKFLGEVIDATLDTHARLVVIDAAADTFGGADENNRGQARQFIQRGLGQIIVRLRKFNIDGAVLCNAHPSARRLVGNGRKRLDRMVRRLPLSPLDARPRNRAQRTARLRRPHPRTDEDQLRRARRATQTAVAQWRHHT
jgi:hypothetical protein